MLYIYHFILTRFANRHAGHQAMPAKKGKRPLLPPREPTTAEATPCHDAETSEEARLLTAPIAPAAPARRATTITRRRFSEVTPTGGETLERRHFIAMRGCAAMSIMGLIAFACYHAPAYAMPREYGSAFSPRRRSHARTYDS